MKLYLKIRNLNGFLKSINSFCTLYEESLKEKVDPDIIDDLIIESKQLFLKYEMLGEYFHEKNC